MVQENVSMVGAWVMVPQVSTPMGMGTALTRESGGNVTRPVSSTAPVTASRALVSSKIETEPVMVRCATAVNCTTIHLRRQRHHTVGPARSPRCGACWPTDAIALGEAVQGKRGSRLAFRVLFERPKSAEGLTPC